MKNNTGSAAGKLILVILLAIIIAFGGVYCYQKYSISEETTIKEEISKYNMANENLKYYYNQLNDLGKLIYLKVNDNKENLKLGNYKIEFGDEMSSILNNECSFDDLESEYKKALDAFVMDNPDVFYIDTSKMVLNVYSRKTLIQTSYIVSIEAEEGKNYYLNGIASEEQVNEMLKEISLCKNRIMASLSGNEAQKIEQVNNYLVDNMEYYNSDTGDIRSLYAGLISKKVVCEGYARSFQYLMNELNIPNILIVGYGENKDKVESHAWNYVKVDGNWYAVDVTWDDPVLAGDEILSLKDKTAYLLKGRIAFDINHHETGKISKNGLSVVYPQLCDSDYSF